jgi:hypothetical protein
MKNVIAHDGLNQAAGYLWLLATSHGGFTQYLDYGGTGYITHEPEPVGFVVSWPSSGLNIKGEDLTPALVFGWLLWLKSHLPLPLCVGGWKDSDTGDFYLDVNTIATTEAEAQQLAVKWGQIAYFDLANQREVRE